MEAKDEPLRPPAPAGRPADDQSEKKPNNLLKQRINNFLISYFNYLALALAFIIFAAGLFLFLYPQYQRIVKNDATAKKSLQTEYDGQVSYLSAIRDLKTSYQSISEADRKKIEEMVPAGGQIVKIIPEIESIVLKNGASLLSIKIEEDFKVLAKAKTKVGSGDKQEPLAGIFGQPPAGVSLAKIEVALSSVNYPVLKNLLKTFENNLRLLDVARVDYEVNENRAAFIIYAYYLSR